MVTITIVGYGDFYPVTTLGRVVGVLVMVTGVGIIGSLASILASFLVSSPAQDEEQINQFENTHAAANDAGVAAELARLSSEVAALREELAAGRT